MADYQLVTVWRIEAPVEVVYATVCEPLRWPEWWPDALRIEERQAGAGDGVGRLLHCTWHGALPYRLSFDLLTTRIEPPRVVEGVVSGDLEGVGRCLFSETEGVTTVRHEWRVRTTPGWMNLLAPWAGPLFKRNHALAMRRGGEGLAHRLDARLLSFEHNDLAAQPVRRADEAMAIVGAGLAAGVIATAAQIALWWVSLVPVLATLARDARLTAAIVMGPTVLPPPNTLRMDVILVATLIHFALSIAYSLVLARLISQLRPGWSLLAGGIFGMALYLVNLYGFTTIFPWFAVARDWVTALTHVTFGISLAGGYWTLRWRRPAAPGR